MQQAIVQGARDLVPDFLRVIPSLLCCEMSFLQHSLLEMIEERSSITTRGTEAYTLLHSRMKNGSRYDLSPNLCIMLPNVKNEADKPMSLQDILPVFIVGSPCAVNVMG